MSVLLVADIRRGDEVIFGSELAAGMDSRRLGELNGRLTPILQRRGSA